MVMNLFNVVTDIYVYTYIYIYVCVRTHTHGYVDMEQYTIERLNSIKNDISI